MLQKLFEETQARSQRPPEKTEDLCASVKESHWSETAYSTRDLRVSVKEVTGA